MITSTPPRKIRFTGVIPALFQLIKHVTTLLSFHIKINVFLFRYATVDLFRILFFLFVLVYAFCSLR